MRKNCIYVLVLALFLICIGCSGKNVSTGDSEQQENGAVNETGIAGENKKEEKELVSVISTDILVQDTEHKTLYPDLIEVVIKNNSDETLRHYKVGFLAYDESGYPKKIELRFDFSGGDYEKFGVSEDANVLPGETYGKDSGWELSDPHHLHYVLACVYEASFYNDETWENPNYKNWLKTFMGKQLPTEYRN